MNEQQQPKGWRSIIIHPDMPLAAIVHFLNVLNERLCTLEDLKQVTDENGQHCSLTEWYSRQQEDKETEEE